MACLLCLACAWQQARLVRRLSVNAREHPAFFTLNVLALVHLAVLLPMFFAWKGWEIPRDLHAMMFWKFRTVQMAVLGWSIGEASRSRRLYVIGTVLGILLAGWFELSGSLLLHRGYGFAIAAAAVLLSVRRDRQSVLVLYGIAISNLFPAISETSGVILGNNELLRFVPTVSFLIAQILWLRAFPSESDDAALSRKCTLSY